MATREEVNAWLRPQGYKLKDDAEGSWSPGRSWWDRYIENVVKVSGASIAKGVGGIIRSGGEAILDDRPFYQQALEEYGGEGVPSPEELASKQSPHGATGTWGKTIEEKINKPEGLSEIVGSFVAGTGKSLADSAGEIIERLRPREDASWLEKTGFEVLHNIGVNAPGLAVSIIKKKPVYGLATLGGVSYGNNYTDERNMGATPDEAHQRASAAMGSEVATELVPISVIMKPGLKLSQRIGYNILSEILGENVNTAYEMMQDRAIHNPDMPLGDFITQELLPAFGNTTKVSALSSFIMGAAAHPFTRGTPRIEQSNKQEVPGIETAKTEIKEAGEVGKPEVPTPVVDGGKPQGKEPGGAVQVGGTGKEEASTGGVLQRQKEVKATPAEEPHSTEQGVVFQLKQRGKFPKGVSGYNLGQGRITPFVRDFTANIKSVAWLQTLTNEQLSHVKDKTDRDDIAAFRAGIGSDIRADELMKYVDAELDRRGLVLFGEAGSELRRKGFQITDPLPYEPEVQQAIDSYISKHFQETPTRGILQAREEVKTTPAEVPQTATTSITSQKDALDNAATLHKASYGLKPKNSLGKEVKTELPSQPVSPKEVYDKDALPKALSLHEESRVTSEQAQKAVDDYIDILVEKYGDINKVLDDPIKTLNKDEISQLDKLYKERDAIDTKDLKKWRDSIINKSKLTKEETISALKEIGFDSEKENTAVTFTYENLKKWTEGSHITNNLNTLYNHFARSNKPYESTYAKFVWSGTGDNPTIDGSVFDGDLRPAKWNTDALVKTQEIFNLISETQNVPPIDLLKRFNLKRVAPAVSKEPSSGGVAPAVSKEPSSGGASPVVSEGPWQMDESKIIELSKNVATEKTPLKTIGYRYGNAPESGYSYNTRENIQEKGVSMASVAGIPESRSFATMAAKERGIKYYEGDIIGYGGDDEAIMINLVPLTESDYKSKVSSKQIKYTALQLQAKKYLTQKTLENNWSNPFPYTGINPYTKEVENAKKEFDRQLKVLKDYPDLQTHVPGVQGEQKASKQFFLDAMVADQKITAEDAQDISNIISEHGWTDKEVLDFVKIANNLGVTGETETNKVKNALFVSLLKQEVYKKNEEKYKWEIAANDKTISNLVKTLKIRGGSPESVKLNVDNVLSTRDEFAKIKTPEELYKVIDETFGKSITFKQLGNREIQNLAAAMLTEGKEGKKITRLEDVDKDAIETLADKAKLEKIRDATPGTVLNAVEQRAAGYIKKYMAMRAHSIGDLYKQAQNQQEKNEILDAFSQAIDSFLNIDLVERGSSSEGALSMRVQRMPLEEGVLPIEGEVRIPAAEEIEKIRSLPKDKILQILEVFGKAKTQPEYDEIAKRLTESFGRNLFETINQIWINGLLSALPTHAVNLSSGIYTALAAPAERYFAEKLSPGGGVAKGEAARLLYGEYLAFWDGLKAARAMWKTGRSLLTNETKWEIHRTDRLTSANANIMMGKLGFGNMNKSLARVVDFMGKSILNLPVRGLITADEFFKVLNYKADIYAIAHRKVTNKILEGKLDAKYAARKIAYEAANPTYAMKDEAMNFAREQTMSRPDGTVTQILNTIIDRFPPAKIIVPFRIAPESIIKYGLERFPALNMVHHETRDNLFGRNGAVARDMELGKMAFGGSVLGTVGLLALAGFITGGGPRDPELRKEWLKKNNPYSLNFGGGYSFSFKRFDFMLFGLVADLSEIAYHASDTELAKTGVAIWYALKNNLVDRQYLDGIMNVIDAFDRGGNAAYNYVKNLSGSGIPAIVALGAKASDPVVRDVVTIMDRMKSRIPGMSDDLPAVRNLYGEKTMHSPTFGSIWVSPILMGVPNNDPVYDEIIKNQIEVSYPERYIEGTSPGKFPSLSTQRTGHGVALTPQQYEQLMIYFGEGMKEDLTNAINSDAYKEGTEGVDGRQAAIIRSVINRHKENARDRLVYETESLQKQIYEKKQRKYEALNR